MPEIANWNGHSFVVSSNLIRGFTDLTIKGACETTEKNTDNQKYFERKYGEAGEISMTVDLNALMGVTDVYSEAMAFYTEANEGASAYFYLGGTKLIPSKLILTSAQITEIIHMPGKGNVWIQCKVALTFRQGAKNDGATAPSKAPNSGSKKTDSGTSTGKKQTVSTKLGREVLASPYNAKFKAQAAAVNAGKTASKDAKGGSAGLAAQEKAIENVKATVTQKNTGTKQNPTTGRAPTAGVGKKNIVRIEVK